MKADGSILSLSLFFMVVVEERGRRCNDDDEEEVIPLPDTWVATLLRSSLSFFFPPPHLFVTSVLTRWCFFFPSPRDCDWYFFFLGVCVCVCFEAQCCPIFPAFVTTKRCPREQLISPPPPFSLCLSLSPSLRGVVGKSEGGWVAYISKTGSKIPATAMNPATAAAVAAARHQVRRGKKKFHVVASTYTYASFTIFD